VNIFQGALVECHYAFEQYLGPQDGIYDLSEIRLGHRLLMDEILETLQAHNYLHQCYPFRAEDAEVLETMAWNHWGAFVKELNDVLYTAFGMLLRLGAPAQVPQNLLYLDFQTAYEMYRRSAEVAAKRPAELIRLWPGVVAAMGRYETEWDMIHMPSVTGEELRELLRPLLDTIIRSILGLEKGLSLTTEPLFMAVHENNLSKLVDGKPLKNASGKFIKPPGYQPVDLVPLLKRFWRGAL
jgi:predicted HAD superfamily Cof-like phosphohydrolase